MKKVTFNMEPFTCPSCVKKIENAVGGVGGVQEARVMFSSGRVHVDFDESRVDVNELENTIVRLGYPVLSSKVS
ncbi:MAG: copper chaperone [Castellaniella sp.]|uniref:heavy-metal-associated domain-containing protein n=1 Tax=Castellaniella sp. TaxID=1955812 RepID=UPI00121AC21A|nr:heavy-metal-associated domain-containing protein [Castellaniella sp.]TAN30161.1 MAG: copper chaperone [Castellaniella sp.]